MGVVGLSAGVEIRSCGNGVGGGGGFAIGVSAGGRVLGLEMRGRAAATLHTTALSAAKNQTKKGNKSHL